MFADSRGLYETLVTEALAARIDRLPPERRAVIDELRTADAADRIAWHIGSVVDRAVESLPEKERVTAAIDLARRLVELIVQVTNATELAAERVLAPGEILRAI